MRAVVQRVQSASVSIEGIEVSRIAKGLLVLLGAMQGDEISDIEYTVKKCVGLRIFSDENGKMNLSVKDVGGEILLVSQFTLLGDARHGNRPSFLLAGKPEESQMLYNRAVEEFQRTGLTIRTGKFGADMKVSLENDGPVTILIDSRKVF